MVDMSRSHLHKHKEGVIATGVVLIAKTSVWQPLMIYSVLVEGGAAQENRAGGDTSCWMNFVPLKNVSITTIV
jgi:hypothetical protein